MTPRTGAGPRHAFRSGRELVERLSAPEPLLAVELRPPGREARAGARAGAGVDRWIDLYHTVRRLTAEDSLVFTTDNATGAREEESLRHLKANLGGDADLSRVVPFLTVKHALDYCLRFPGRAADAGHRAAVIVGGDQHDGIARCVPHAGDLRRLLRERYPGMAFGGWANPYRDPAWQVDLLQREAEVTDFVLTQVVTHHDLGRVEAFLREVEKQALATPVLVGVFYWRSGNPRTLEALRSLLPVPIEGLRREFAEPGVDADVVCARTLAALRGLGLRRFYLCNLPPASAPARLAELRFRLR